MGPVRRHRLATNSTVGLTEQAQLHGLHYLPYPLHTPPPPTNTTAAASGTEQPRPPQHWLGTYRTADLRVTACTFHSDTAIADRRILAWRTDGVGYLATQHDHDTINVFGIDVRDIAAAVAEQINLSGRGQHPRVVVPHYRGYFAALTTTATSPDATAPGTPAEPHEQPLMQPVHTSQPTHTVIPDDDISAVTIIQATTTPAQGWGPDWTQPFAVHIAANGDGDYLYNPNHTHATPTDTTTLTRRIITLIAAQTPARLQMRAY